ncbi:trehalose operon repressor [Staphylococcus sp. 11261D007BR]
MNDQSKFKTIYDALRQLILDGTYHNGEQLPSEHQLVKMYHVSRETVRKSLELLVSEGMIQKVRGKGSVVIYQHVTEFPFTELVSFKEVQQQLGQHYETVVEMFEQIEACDVPEVKRALNINGQEALWHFVRYRQLNGVTKIIDEDYVRVSVLPSLTKEVVQNSLYEFIEAQGLEIGFSSKSLTFEPFGNREQRVFENVTPAYTATIRGIVHLKDTTCFQYNISKHIATEFKFTDFSRRGPH